MTPRTRGAAVAAASAVAVAGTAVALRSRTPSQPADPTVDFTGNGFEVLELDTPAGRMRTYVAGPASGRPLVFLHGIGGGASSWIWSRVAPAFTAQYRVIVPDWVGWGLSEHPRRRLLFDDYVRQLDALLREVGVPSVVVAQSLAAGFAAEVARTSPDRFDRLVMLTPSGGKDFGVDAFGPVPRAVLTPLARSPLGLLLYRALFHRPAFLRSWLVNQGFYDTAAVSDEIVEGYRYSAVQPGAAYGALPFLTGELRFDFAPYMRELKVPAVMLWGASERQVGLDVAGRLAELNPDVDFRLISRARANPELELPDQVVTLLRDVLA